MISMKSRIFNFLIRNRHIFQGKLKKDRFDSNTSIADFRSQCEKSAVKYADIPEGITINKEKIESIEAEWIIPAESDSGKLVLYMHGGGYVSGSCNDHRGFVAKFANFCGYTNLLYEYRLAPENPFPAAIDDSVKVYQWLIRHGYEGKNIIFAGESAGGGLCLALLLALKEREIPLPAAAVAISTWTDLTCSGESYFSKNKVSVAQYNSWNVFSKPYCGINNPRHPLISPVFGDLRNLPPIYINSGTEDELYDDGRIFSRKASEAGVKITFKAGYKMIHCYPLLAPMFREASEAMSEICMFIKYHLSDKK